MAAVTSLTNKLESISSPANVAAAHAADRIVEAAMKPLYGAIKKAEEFVTGVTKLSLTAVFSGANNFVGLQSSSRTSSRCSASRRMTFEARMGRCSRRPVLRSSRMWTAR